MLPLPVIRSCTCTRCRVYVDHHFDVVFDYRTRLWLISTKSVTRDRRWYVTFLKCWE